MKQKNYSIMGVIILVIAGLIGVTIPYIVKDIVDDAPRHLMLLDNKLLLVLAFLVNALLTTLGSFIFVNLAERNAFNLKNKILSTMMEGEYKFYDEVSVAKIPSHLTNNIKVYVGYISTQIPMFILGVVTIVLSIVLLFRLDWRLTLVLICSLPIIGIIVVPISMIANKYSDKLQANLADFSEKLINIFQNMLYIKSLNSEAEVKVKLFEYNQDIKKNSSRLSKLGALIQPFIMLVVMIIISIIFIYGGTRVRNNSITVGVLVSFLIYVFQLLGPVSSFSNFFAEKEKAKANLAELDQYLNIQKEEEGAKQELSTITQIAFNNVSFKYQDKPVLENLNLCIKANEKIAIVGPSGAGKTTLYKLLLGLYKPTAGTINLNDHEIRTIAHHNLREHISLIPQENSIIFTRLIDFFKLGNQSLTNEAILQALNYVSLQKELGLDAENLNTYDFGIGGQNLSTGQKQRLMIAKSILKPSDVYLLDESTASVDAELEANIFNLQNELFQNKIMLSITHRLANVKYVDRVIFMENGQITGDGTHATLYQEHEKYRKYIDLQNIKTLQEM